MISYHLSVNNNILQGRKTMLVVNELATSMWTALDTYNLLDINIDAKMMIQRLLFQFLNL